MYEIQQVRSSTAAVIMDLGIGDNTKDFISVKVIEEAKDRLRDKKAKVRADLLKQVAPLVRGSKVDDDHVNKKVVIILK